MEDDEGSIQILEPDVDQQYVPEGKPASSSAPTKESATVHQKPPVLIVERQVTQAAPERAPADAGVTTTPPLPVERIVNIVDEPARLTAKEKEDWWQNAVGKTVSLTIQFFLMAFVVFFALIVLNPPFVQDTSSPLQKQSASWSKTSLWAAGAGLAFLLLPPLYNVATSRFFPNDLLAATGLRQK